MKKFSLGIGYKDLLHLEQNKACPEELAIGMPGTAVMDNDDFSDDTLTGANTSHRTNVMFVQPQDLVNSNSGVRPTLDIPTPQAMKQLCAAQHTVQP
ncbi:hypothetical protein Pmani_023879 [Petrolisthes manimaculis]|uniref:Uncharacterized protein n=1 Tax=Petrolisthes manimaculis TaxID=1843537 RepID=A0AAE1U2Y1_9EUCA|nr:hypothetical protein Pmani_023879 [Petrolisthes manimaculis]